MRTSTSSKAKLAVSRHVFLEMREKLMDAGYSDQITGEEWEGEIDMNGIALVMEELSFTMGSMTLCQPDVTPMPGVKK